MKRRRLNAGWGAALGLVVLLAAAQAAAQTPPVRHGYPGYDTAALESYESLSALYDQAIEAGDWPAFLRGISADLLAPDDWPGEAASAARAVFLQEIDALITEMQVSVHRALEEGFEDRTSFGEEIVALDAALLGSAVGRFDIDTAGLSPTGLHDYVLFDDRIRWSDPDLSPAAKTRLFMLSESIYLVFTEALRPARRATLFHIRAAHSRWSTFFRDVGNQQYPWELLFNGLLGPRGDIETPPTWQWLLFHATPIVELYDPDPNDDWDPLGEMSVSEGLGVSLIGVDWFDWDGEAYGRRVGVAALLVLNDESEIPGWGCMLHLGDVVELGYIYRGEDRDQGSVVLGADLYALIEKKRAGLAGKRTAFLTWAESVLERRPRTIR